MFNILVWLIQHFIELVQHLIIKILKLYRWNVEIECTKYWNIRFEISNGDRASFFSGEWLHGAHGLARRRNSARAAAALQQRVSGDRSQDIRLTNTNTKLAKKGLELGDKVGKKVVQVAAK